MNDLNVLIIDKLAIARHGLASLLQQSIPNAKQIFTAANTHQALQMLAEKPDLIVMDCNFRLEDGDCLTRYIIERHPRIKILMLSIYANHHLVRYYLELGVDGFISKHDEDIPGAIDTALKGRIYISPGLKYDAKPKRDSIDRIPLNFTTIETCILVLSAQGNNSTQIAQRLGNSKNTVEFHRGKRMIKKFKVKNLTELIHFRPQHR